MTKSETNLITCNNGHQYYDISECPICPVCGQEVKPGDKFLSSLSAPARRALENSRITSAQDLANYTKREILKLHGMGPSSLPKLEQALAKEGLSFRLGGK